MRRMNPADLDPDPATGERRTQDSRCTYANVDLAIRRIEQVRNEVKAEADRLESIPEQVDDGDIRQQQGKVEGIDLVLAIVRLIKP
jgi:hypothetical protein